MTLGILQLAPQYLTVLGKLALALHDTGQVREILRSSLTLAKKLYDIPTQIWVLSNLTEMSIFSMLMRTCSGFMAHEFLTKGTLFGQLYDLARANVPPASSAASSADFRTMKKPNNWGKGKAVELEPKPSRNKIKHEPKLATNQKYVQVSELLKNGGRIPGIVNPSQLARLLHLQPENK
ncbi:hypothetical protein L1987_63889 [Smallanthus sonchifolius]|uniref:Uncharacterized protein n=1 Tax=Smallanthus sonchifolius TaxID=185202 RepID=A0ACB9CEJ0_9ASTR|nr:hypothetical protein L1987_63889 [Smallanthus sonchifolius]